MHFVVTLGIVVSCAAFRVLATHKRYNNLKNHIAAVVTDTVNTLESTLLTVSFHYTLFFYKKLEIASSSRSFLIFDPTIVLKVS